MPVKPQWTETAPRRDNRSRAACRGTQRNVRSKESARSRADHDYPCPCPLRPQALPPKQMRLAAEAGAFRKSVVCTFRFGVGTGLSDPSGVGNNREGRQIEYVKTVQT